MIGSGGGMRRGERRTMPRARRNEREYDPFLPSKFCSRFSILILRRLDVAIFLLDSVWTYGNFTKKDDKDNLPNRNKYRVNSHCQALFVASM